MTSRPLLAFVAALVLVTGTGLFSSCGFGRKATGVVVWAPDGGTVKNGDLVWIWDHSRIRKTAKIERPQGGGSFEVDEWRVLSFPGDAEAQEFQKSFTALKDVWAISGKPGLPVREAPDANANRVYKLGQDEVTKVLEGNRPRVKQGNLEGSWVKILTQDGYSGWVFDYYLTLVDRSSGTDKAVKNGGPGDQLVQAVLAQAWYPEDMRAMVEQERIDLELFREDAGLRAQASPPSFLVVLPGRGGVDERFELAVGDGRKVDSSTYDFGGPQAVKVQFTNAEGSKLTLSFTDQGKARSIPLALLDGNVGTLITGELASRQQKLNEILVRGKTLASPTWGTIALTPEGTFEWTGLTAPLAGVPGGSGKVSFDWFKDKRLLGEFRAVRFQFGEGDEGPSKVFLYRFLKDGFQLLPADDADLDPAKHTVTREPKSGISLFFSLKD